MTHHPGFRSATGESEFLAAYDAVLAQWPVPVRPIEVASVYGRTHINVCGPPDAPPLFLLHSGGATSTVWSANVAELSQAHQVYAVDIIGGPGRSVRDGRPLRTPADLVTWMDGLFDSVGAEKAYLAGHSYGSWIALTYALHAPRRVTKLALLDPTSCFAGLSPSYLWHGVPALLFASGARMRSLIEWETRYAPVVDPKWLEMISLGADTFHGEIVWPRRPSEASLRAWTVPTLVLLAEKARCHRIATVAANAERLMPHVTTEVLPDVAHHSMPGRHADRLNRALLKFFGLVSI
jgi:pimeloyl-ACP methyl ester carboxylesterase